MVDCHIHMVLDGVNWKDAIARHKAAPQAALIRQTLGHYQALGFSYLRDGGDRWGVCDLAAKLALEYGIRYQSPGFPIYKTGHYGGFIGRGFDGLAEYRALVREAKTRGAHFIKLMISGLVLGPWYGFFAAGIGSGLADLLAGYAHYVPGTFIIKGLVALVAALLLRPMLKTGEKIPFWRLALIELPSEVIMVAGYFGYKALILGKGLAAAASIPNNLVQAAVGIVLSVVLYTALAKVPEIHKAFWKGE